MRMRTPSTAVLLAMLPHLRLLIPSGMRNAAIDVAAAKAQGLAVCGTDSHPEPAVELTWVLILSVMRQLVPQANALREQGPWQQSVGRDLHGARLGLPGLGGIRQRVLRIGPAVGMQVSVWRPSLDAGHAEAAGVNLAASKQTPFSSETYWRRRIWATPPSATIAMPSARRSKASPPDCRTRRGACWADADQATAAAR